MEVILGKKAGFCPGVRNTVLKAQKYLKEHSEIYCLGQLVHNPQVVHKLEEKGLKVVDCVSQVPNGANLIVRAHGIPKRIYGEIKEKELQLIDLTCPKVLQIHKQVENYAQLGYYIILIAEKKHPETKGTISFCGKNASIVENLEDIRITVKDIFRKNIRNITIFSQTTFSVEKFDRYASIIKSKIPKNSNLELNRTICDSTKLRQIETAQIAKQVELMIIIGSKTSSNTKKLYDISIQECNNAMQVETLEDLYLNYISRFKKVGVMAGASTPKEIIQQVVETLENTQTQDYIYNYIR